MLKENFITVKEFKDLTGITKQRVNQLMYGSHRKYEKRNGELKIYFQKPMLKENIDFKWDKGRVLINKNVSKRYNKVLTSKIK